MKNRVEIQMFGGFCINVFDQHNRTVDGQPLYSKKKISLLTYLVLQDGAPVTTQRLVREMWSSKKNLKSVASLKTTVSRLRIFLNELSPGLGECICSGKGTYYWQDKENVHVDVLEFIKLVKHLRQPLSETEQAEAINRILTAYRGDLYLTGDIVNGEQYASWLHREYLEAIYAYVEKLKEKEAYNEIMRVCQQALQIDEMDEILRIELMRAMVNLNRSEDAVSEYHRAASLERNLMDADPGEDLQAYYRELTEAGRMIHFNLDVIRNELLERENERQGPFFCDYAAFKEIYNIQMRNIERLGSTMFLALIMVRSKDKMHDDLFAVRRESSMAALQEIMRKYLRKGDIVTRFSPDIYAMLLPTVNYSTGSMVLERIEQVFYEEYASNKVDIYHRITPLGSTMFT